MMYSVAHTHVENLWALAQPLGFAMYKRRLNSWVYIWCIDLPEDNVHSTRLLLQFGDAMTKIADV